MEEAVERKPFKGWLEGSRLEGLLAGGWDRGVELLDILLEYVAGSEGGEMRGGERSGPGAGRGRSPKAQGLSSSLTPSGYFYKWSGQERLTGVTSVCLGCLDGTGCPSIKPPWTQCMLSASWEHLGFESLPFPPQNITAHYDFLREQGKQTCVAFSDKVK